MDVFNLFGDHEWDATNDHEGFRHRRVAAGKQLGARLLGGSLYELPPGERTWPYHYEEGCEEWVLAVSGRPTLRGPDGERELEPGRPRRVRRGAGGRAPGARTTPTSRAAS